MLSIIYAITCTRQFGSILSACPAQPSIPLCRCCHTMKLRKNFNIAMLTEFTWKQIEQVHVIIVRQACKPHSLDAFDQCDGLQSLCLRNIATDKLGVMSM